VSSFIWGALLIALFFGIARLFPKREDRIPMPLSERACERLRRFGQWIIDVSSAWDIAICAYRRLRSFPLPELHSMRERNATTVAQKDSEDSSFSDATDRYTMPQDRNRS